MAKIRSLKAEFFRDEDISAGGLTVKTLAAGLICCVADDEGRFKVSLARLRGEIFTHDTIAIEDIEVALGHLKKVGWVVTYGPVRQRIGAILRWSDHQRVPTSRFVASKLPPPPNTSRRKHGAYMPHTAEDDPHTGRIRNRNRKGIGTGIGKDAAADAQAADVFGNETAAADLGSRFHKLAVVLNESVG